MKEILVRGTLGDAFTAGLKIKEDINILHYTAHKHWYKEIKEIYSIFPKIKKVDFVEFMFPETKEISGVPEKGMDWFPDLKHIKKIFNEAPEMSYVAIFPHAGREDAMARKIDIRMVEKMIESLLPIPTILLGTDKRYKDIKCCKNLIGKTSILEAIEIIINSSGFCGPEGFPCFVALSQRKPSVVFYVREQPVQARLLGNPWTQHIIDLIKIGGI